MSKISSGTRLRRCVRRRGMRSGIEPALAVDTGFRLATEETGALRRQCDESIFMSPRAKDLRILLQILMNLNDLQSGECDAGFCL